MSWLVVRVSTAMAVAATSLVLAQSAAPGTALAAPGNAIATSPWTGSLSVVAADAFALPGEIAYSRQTAGEYRNIQRAVTGGPVDSEYRADVTLSYRELRTSPCGGNEVGTTVSTMTYAGPSTATVEGREDNDIQFGVGGYAFELWDLDAGTFFQPSIAIFNAVTVGSCGSGPSFTGRQANDALGYQNGGTDAPASPLLDTDPDPDRLVGTTTYSLGNLPSGPRWDYLSYEYVVKYDLTRAASAAEVLTVGVSAGDRFGSVVGSGISCGRGVAQCSASLLRGTSAVLTARPSETGRFSGWAGCDSVQGLQCWVTMDSARSVFAAFTYDFIGQAEAPEDGLFSLDQKADIAGGGADYAHNGALGCLMTAGVVALAPAEIAVVVGSRALPPSQAQALFEQTLGNCAEGVVGTVASGVLLLIDPPDPNWRELAVAEPMPRTAPGRCPLPQRCAQVMKARADLRAAEQTVASRHEALAVAANRYGNAVSARDRSVMAQQAISARTLKGMLADAAAVRDSRSRELVRQLKAAGLSSATLRASGRAALLRSRAGGKGIPGAAVDRLVRKHLVTDRAQAIADVRVAARRQQARPLDLYSHLLRRTPVAALRRDASRSTVADLVVLVQQLQAQQRTPSAVVQRHQDLLTAALRCDAASPAALRSLATSATIGIGGDAGAQVAWAARNLASRGVPVGPACTP